MLVPFADLLERAAADKYALGAFNIYNLEGALAVLRASEELNSPVILQILPSALDLGGRALIRLCLAAAEDSFMPVAVHLDHCSDPEMIAFALDSGVSSVMADGSSLSFEENTGFTARMVKLAGKYGCTVEGELGFLSGTEDCETVDESLEKYTLPHEAEIFVKETGVGALAICIGNRHGKYLKHPLLDFERLREISALVSIPLVLHGTSGLPDHMIRRSVELGICKFNVNTEVRNAYLYSMADYLTKTIKDQPGNKPELIPLMRGGIDAMAGAVMDKIRLFGSMDKI